MKNVIVNMIAIPCEIYSRVVGYYRPIQQWNPGKRAEFWDRVPYKIEENNDTPRTEADEKNNM